MSRRPGLFDPCPCGSGKRFHSCCKVLGAAANDPARLTALAVRKHAAGDHASAETLYRKALEVDASYPDALRNLALLLADRGEFDAAEPLLRRCLELQPDAFASYFALGTVLARQKRLEAAAEAFRAASEADPQSVHALVNLGAVLAELGRGERATEALERALHLDPGNADAALNLALLRSERGEHAAALELAGRAARAAGADPRVHGVHGMLALRAASLDAALGAFQSVLASRPDDFDARVNTGSCLADLGRPGDAIVHFEHALRLQPDSAKLWCNLALARLETRQLAAAQEAVARAAACDPSDPMVIGHQGLLAALTGEYDDALAFYRAALEREPENIAYCIGLASVLYETQGPAEAARAYEAFLRVNPGSTSAHFELATQLLQVGRFSDAWPHYEFRNQTQFRRSRSEPRPPLGALRGQPLVLRFEQGLGDQLFFLRFVPAMRALAGAPSVTYISKPEIASLVKQAAGIDTVAVTQGAHDAPGLLIGDLPSYVMARGASVPEPLRLAASSEARDRARRVLAEAGPGPYLAATWEAGSPPGTERERRLAMLKLHKRIDPQSFGAALAAWPGTVLSLQRAPRASDQAAFDAGLGRSAASLSELNKDLDAMLAVLELVDEYVGVSNTNMHLRAAAGRPARVLVPRPYEWRWMYEGTGSPWFPGFRVYREARDAGWKPALEALARELAERP